MLFEQYNLSRLLDRMEAEGHVRRIPYPGDRRRQLVEITEEGRLLQRRMWGVYGPAINRHIGAKLTDKEAGNLAGLLLKFKERAILPPVPQTDNYFGTYKETGLVLTAGIRLAL